MNIVGRFPKLWGRKAETEAFVSEHGGLIYIIRDPIKKEQAQLSSVIDQDYLPVEKFKDPELRLIEESEDYTQNIFSQISHRVYSGLPAYTHVLRNVEIKYDLAKKTDVDLKLVNVLNSIFHDVFEDDPEVRKLRKRMEMAYQQQDIQDINEISNTLSDMLLTKKKTLGEYLKSGFAYTRASGEEKANLREAIDTSVRITYDLSRNPAKQHYAVYIKELYSKKGKEKPINALYRILSKNVDRISNLTEHKELYDNTIMTAMHDAFSSTETVYQPSQENNNEERREYKVGKELSKRFGSSSLESQSMPSAIKVMTGFESIFPNHYMNVFLNNHYEKIMGDPEASAFLPLVLESRKAMNEATHQLLDLAISDYESKSEVKPIIKEMDERITNNRDHNYYSYINPIDGIYNKLLLCDIIGKSGMATHYASGKRLQTIYRMGRHSKEQLSLFEGVQEHEGGPVYFQSWLQSDNRKFKLFILSGSDDLLEYVKGDNLRDLMLRSEFVGTYKPEKSAFKKITGTNISLF